jgi:hypothetical protein
MLSTALTVRGRAAEPDWTQAGPSQLWTRRLYFSQFAAAATTGNLDIAGFPAGMVIKGAYAWLIANFTGGAVGSATLSIGTTGAATAYMAATSVFTGARKQLVGLTQVPGLFLNATTPTAAGTVRFALVTTVANTNALTAGAVDVFLDLAAVPLRVS